MGNGFTDEENRFLLAEVIKTSKADVAILSEFLRQHRIEPNWMQMQLPAGRNMTQSMQAAEDLGLPPPTSSWLKRKPSGEQGEPAAKRMSFTGRVDPALGVTGAPNHVPILPRPPNVNHDPVPPPPPLPPAAPAAPAPKKKGRPARGDKPKLQANLPPKIAPRPAGMKHGEELPQQKQPQNGSTEGNSTNTHDFVNYGVGYITGPPAGSKEQKNGGSSQPEMGNQGMMAGPTYEQPGNPLPMMMPNLVPLEPEPRASNSANEGPNFELTRLAPIVDPQLGAENNGFLSSPHNGNQASVGNSN